MKKKKIVILGSTGTIGTNAINVIKHLPQSFEVVGLSANTRIQELMAQAFDLNVKHVVIGDEKDLPRARMLGTPDMKIDVGIQGLLEMACGDDVDIVVCAIVGTTGLLPMLEAAKRGKRLAIASKEILVMAGDLMNDAVKQHHAHMLPIDSEHSAILQCLQGREMSEVKRLILTASGGPFRGKGTDYLNNVTPEMALKHPTWQMGKKITTDSATLMNKALEYIEAFYLFDVKMDQLDVVIHPQSIIHSMIEFVDGALLAQMGEPDMCVPIQYALTYPERKVGIMPAFDFFKHHHLTFEKLDENAFPALQFARFALEKRGSFPAVLNAANEVAVERFHAREITFTDIFYLVEKMLNEHKEVVSLNLESILDVDREVRKKAYAF